MSKFTDILDAPHVGQPTKITKERIEILTDALVAGATIKGACAIVGITRTTYDNWLKHAREDMAAGKKSQYVLFFDRCQRAKEITIPRMEMLLAKECEKDGNLLLKRLAQLDPARYGNRTYIEVKDTTGRPDEVTDNDIITRILSSPEAVRTLETISEDLLPEGDTGTLGADGEQGSMDASTAPEAPGPSTDRGSVGTL